MAAPNKQKEPSAYQINPRVYANLCGFLSSLYNVTELSKINVIFTELQNGTRVIYPPDPEKPAKANGKGTKKPKLESVGKEN